MAIAVAWQTVASVTTIAATVYTTPATNATTFAYARDLVVNNSGASTIFVGLGVSSVATSVASFAIPAGGSLILSQCQVPNNQPLTAISGLAAGSSISIGYASVFSAV